MDKKSQITLLVAEDEFFNFIYIEEILADTNINIIRANNGQEAIDKINKHAEIDVILMDINMPVMNGLDASKKIKQIRKDVPIIIQTAFREVYLNDTVADAIIYKPYFKKELVSQIESKTKISVVKK